MVNALVMGLSAMRLPTTPLPDQKVPIWAVLALMIRMSVALTTGCCYHARFARAQLRKLEAGQRPWPWT
jgi:hypothetical protein